MSGSLFWGTLCTRLTTGLLSGCLLIETSCSQYRDYGVLLLGEDPETGVDVALKLVEEGLAKVRDNSQDETLQKAQEAAKAAKKGMWGENTGSHTRDIQWDVDSNRARALVDKFAGKPVSAVVEHVIDGTTMRMFLLPDMIHVTLMMSGLRAPATR